MLYYNFKSWLLILTLLPLLYTCTLAEGLSLNGTNQYINCGTVTVTGNNPRTIEA